MGTRYHLTVRCPNCQYVDDDAYYAPTCGFTDWTCPKCGLSVDLEEYTGITYEEASSLGEIQDIMDDIEEDFGYDS